MNSKEKERQELIFRLRSCGFSIEEILVQVHLESDRLLTKDDEIDYDAEKVLVDLKAAIANYNQDIENLHLFRQLELKKYDVMYSALYPRLIRGDSEAITLALNISKERNKVLGLYVPVEIKFNQMVDEKIQVELNKFLRSLGSDPRISENTLAIIQEISVNALS